MKKNIFAHWLLDIGKYVSTALIISHALGSIELGWTYYIVSVSFVIFIVLLGLSLLDSKKN